MGGYLVAAYGIQYFRGSDTSEVGEAIINRVAHAAAFGGSIMVLMGMFDPLVLRHISVKSYLIFAAFIGLIYSLRKLVK